MRYAIVQSLAWAISYKSSVVLVPMQWSVQQCINSHMQDPGYVVLSQGNVIVEAFGCATRHPLNSEEVEGSAFRRSGGALTKLHSHRRWRCKRIIASCLLHSALLANKANKARSVFGAKTTRHALAIRH